MVWEWAGLNNIIAFLQPAGDPKLLSRHKWVTENVTFICWDNTFHFSHSQIFCWLTVRPSHQPYMYLPKGIQSGERDREKALQESAPKTGKSRADNLSKCRSNPLLVG